MALWKESLLIYWILSFSNVSSLVKLWTSWDDVAIAGTILGNIFSRIPFSNVATFCWMLANLFIFSFRKYSPPHRELSLLNKVGVAFLYPMNHECLMYHAQEHCYGGEITLRRQEFQYFLPSELIFVTLSAPRNKYLWFWLDIMMHSFSPFFESPELLKNTRFLHSKFTISHFNIATVLLAHLSIITQNLMIIRCSAWFSFIFSQPHSTNSYRMSRLAPNGKLYSTEFWRLQLRWGGLNHMWLEFEK